MRPDEPTPPAPTPPPPSGSFVLEPAASRPHHRRRMLVVVAAVVVAVLLAAGGAAAFVTMRGAGEHLLDHVPAGTDAVAVAYLDPGAGQKLNLLRMAGRFPSLGSSQQLHDNVNRALDAALGGAGLDHADLDWVGPEVGVAFDVPTLQAPTVSVLITTTDPSASSATLQKLRDRSGAGWTSATYEGVTVWTANGLDNGPSAQAIVDGVVVIGNSRSMVEGIIDASHGNVPRLQDDENFEATMRDLPASKLGFVYVDAARLVDLLKEQPGLRTLSAPADPALQNLEAVQGIAVSLSAQPDGLALDATEHYDRSKLSPARVGQLNASAHPNPLLTSVPQGSSGVVSVEHVDTSLGSLVAQARARSPQVGHILDVSGVSAVLSALSGDVVVEGESGSPSSSLGGALLLGASNDGRMQAALGRLAGYLSHTEHLAWQREVYRGVKIEVIASGSQDLPIRPAYALVGHAAVVTTSLQEMERIVDASRGGPNITTSPDFVAARNDVPAGSLFFLDIQSVLGEIRTTLPPDQRARFDHEVAANLAHVGYLVAGSGSTAESTRARVFIRIT